ncbi:MAG: hypothetical protein ACOYK9_04850 [Chlamydiia bacterium]
MKKEIKAHYNLLKAQVAWDPSTPHETWMVEDLSLCSDKDIFGRLLELKVPVSQETIAKYLEEIETPEDFLEATTLETDHPEKVEKIYLLLFELFKRFSSKGSCLSIFADQLDSSIQKYEATNGRNWQELLEFLKQFELILRENLNHAKNPVEVLEKISRYFAYDIEGFIYDFIADLIDREEEVQAEALIELFYEYITKPYWFQLLEFYLKESTEELLENLSDLAQEVKDIEFTLEILHILKEEGSERFATLLSLAVDFAKEEAEFVELLIVAQEFFEERDRMREVSEIKKILDSRAQIDEKRKIHPQDPGCNHFKKIVDRV